MQLTAKIVRGLSSPPILIAAVWCAALFGVAIGPIDYSQQPSPAVLILVATGVSLFVLAHQGGAWCFQTWLWYRPNPPTPSIRILNITVAAASLVGVAGIALIALDRVIMSGVNSGGYAELLRCAPDLVDFIEIKRTLLIYLGYLTFSFGYAALALFLLKGEEINGWIASLAQLAIVSPAGYALLYSGRMPILFMMVLVISAGLVRIRQGRSVLPRGHHLLVKMIVVFVLFGAYSNAMWSSRRNFCVQMSGLIQRLMVQTREQQQPAPESRPAEPNNDTARAVDHEKEARSVQQLRMTAEQELEQARGPRTKINAAALSSMIDRERASSAATEQAQSAKVSDLLARMEAWHAKPRGYVLSAIESGHLSPGAAMNLLSTYFYITNGVRIVDVVWHARAQFSPNWGAYEIGVLSPILRIFFPQNQLLANMSTQLKSAEIHGFFPTVWAAAYIDFGAGGAVIYVLIWGFAAGWSAFGARHSALVMPPLLLTFVLASILLSLVQGPLGIGNSAMILASMLLLGLVIDLQVLMKSWPSIPEGLPALR